MKRVLLLIGLILILSVFFLVHTYYPQLEVANGYAAKKMCSCTFVAERTQESIQNEDLGSSPLNLTKTVIDHQNQSVHTSLYGLATRTAVYRDHLGCILLDGKDDYQHRLDDPGSALPDSILSAMKPTVKINPLLETSVDLAFTEDAKTRGVLVIHRDTIVAERYAPGYDRDTKINGWSMTKSITSTLIGILVKQGKLSLEDRQLFKEWTDDRKEIQLKDLLQMQSGLQFEESYGEVTDATNMLFRAENVSQIPLASDLARPPGTNWYYSSGTSNLLSQLIRNRMADDGEYHQFPYRALFDKLGMKNTILESDESGTYVGSSFCFATLRDWAQFGRLYLKQGHWFGEQIIDSSWVDFTRTPATHSSDNYGGHFWLNKGGKHPDVPRDMYSCNGFQGQYVYIFPSHDLVVVRMGLGKEMDFNRFLSSIVDALPQPY